MTNEQRSKPDMDRPMIYQISIKGHLSQQWMIWFEDLTVTLEEDGNTLLIGVVVDQPALHGILKKIRDLGIPLLSLQFVDTDPHDSSGLQPPPKKQQAPDS